MLTAGVLLLFVSCAHILYWQPRNAIFHTPAPLASRNVEKALKVRLRHRQVSAVLLISLILAGDIHANPGPHPKNVSPCGLWERNVAWNDPAMTCDDCSVWYYRTCIELCTADSSLLNRPSINWICHQGDITKCGTFTFQSFSLGTSNYYDPFIDHSIDSFNSSSPFSPLKTTSPGGRTGDRTVNESSKYYGNSPKSKAKRNTDWATESQKPPASQRKQGATTKQTATTLPR